LKRKTVNYVHNKAEGCHRLVKSYHKYEEDREKQ